MLIDFCFAYFISSSSSLRCCHCRLPRSVDINFNSRSIRLRSLALRVGAFVA